MSKTKPEIRMVAAIAANGTIGHQNRLPWNIEQEYNHYLELIRDQTVIMGRRSYEIFGTDLTSKRNVVVSKTINHRAGITVCNSLDGAIEFASKFNEIIYIAGGVRIYQQGLAMADSLYISHIHRNYKGDTFFPSIDPKQWQRAKSVSYPDFTFTIYRRT